MEKPVVLLVSWLLMMTIIAEACNEAICASQVSKCMLIKCCECDMSDKKNCTCCHDCQICLSQLYTECCSCIGMCPPPDPSENPYKTSSIEDLKEPLPDLFSVLTEDDDVLQRWTSYRYQVYSDALYYTVEHKTALDSVVSIGNKQGNVKEMPGAHQGIKSELLNCTVAFMSQCMSIRKCKASCKSMGAARYRWFHDFGCCQCIGSTCPGYGLNDPKCIKCKEEEEDEMEIEGEVKMQEGVVDETKSSLTIQDAANSKPKQHLKDNV